MIYIHASPYIPATKQTTKRMTRKFESYAIKSQRNPGKKHYSLSVTIPTDTFFFMKDIQTFLCHESQLFKVITLLEQTGTDYKVTYGLPSPPLNLSIRPPKEMYNPSEKIGFFAYPRFSY